MSNITKLCNFCKGTGKAKRDDKLDGRDALYTCKQCGGTGVSLYDEDFDSALPFLGETEEDYLDDEE